MLNSKYEDKLVEAIGKYGKNVDFKKGNPKKCLCKLPEKACDKMKQPSIWNTQILRFIGVEKSNQKVLYGLTNSRTDKMFPTKMSICLAK